MLILPHTPHNQVHDLIIILLIIGAAVGEDVLQIPKTIAVLREINVNCGHLGLLLELPEYGPEPRIINVLDIQHHIFFGCLFFHKICQQSTLLFEECPSGSIFVQLRRDIEFELVLKRLVFEVLG